MRSLFVFCFLYIFSAVFSQNIKEKKYRDKIFIQLSTYCEQKNFTVDTVSTNEIVITYKNLVQYAFGGNKDFRLVLLFTEHFNKEKRDLITKHNESLDEIFRQYVKVKNMAPPVFNYLDYPIQGDTLLRLIQDKTIYLPNCVLDKVDVFYVEDLSYSYDYIVSDIVIKNEIEQLKNFCLDRLQNYSKKKITILNYFYPKLHSRLISQFEW